MEEADEGQVIRQNGLRLSYLSQHPQFPEGATILVIVRTGINRVDEPGTEDTHCFKCWNIKYEEVYEKDEYIKLIVEKNGSLIVNLPVIGSEVIVEKVQFVNRKKWKRKNNAFEAVFRKI